MSRQGGIGFSKVLGPWGLAVLAISIAFSVAGLVGGGAVLISSGADAPKIIAIGALLLLPVLLCYVSRASETEREGTAYSIVRNDGGSTRLFATGWLSLAGYLSLAALMIEAVALRIGRILESFLGMEVFDISVVAPVAALAVLSQLISPVEHLRARLALAGVALAAAVGLILSVAIAPPQRVPGVELPVLPARHFLSGAALLGGCLWFVDVALDYRRVYRKGDTSLAIVLTLCWATAIAFTVAIAAIVLAQPDLFTRVRGIPGDQARDNIRAVGLVVTLILCWITVSKAFSRMQRLSAAMARDGSVPELFERGQEEESAPVPIILLFGTVAGALALFVPVRHLVAVAAVTFLWCGVVTFASQLRSGGGKRAPAFRLPLYPLFPIVSLVVCLFFSLIVPWNGPLIVFCWLIAGFGFRLLYRREARELGAAPEIEEADDEDVPVPEEGSVYRVLVGLGPASDGLSLIRLGHDLARARGGDVVVLRVVALLERLPRSEVRRIARRQWKALRALVRETLGEAPDAFSIVRIATSIDSGILDAASSHEADLVLLDTPRHGAGRANDHNAVVDSVFLSSKVAVALVHGQVPADVRRVVAAVARGPDTPSVLSVGETVGMAREGELVALSVRSQLQTEDHATLETERLVADTEIAARVVTTEDDDPARGITRVAGASDVVVMGTTRDRALTHAGTTGLWRDVIDGASGAAILVRRAERRRAGWLREGWDIAFSALPTLTVGERAEVYSQMRHSATATVDFYVLIIISSALAIFGLFQDSAAVVIGAMLVAPLMSPIVAIAQGIVQGNLRMIRKGLASTMKGTIVAVLVAAFFTLAVPDAPPTPQILARTQPTLLDLGVGLAAGAAAAYGVSRKSVAAALPGVAIAVALVPPLCVVGYGLGADRLDIAFGATLLYLTNLVAIVFVATVLFMLLGFYPRQADRRKAVRGAVLASVAGVVLLSIPLTLSSWETSRVGQLELVVDHAFRREADERRLQLENVRVRRIEGEYVVRATMYAPPDFPQASLQRLLQELEDATGIDARLEVRLVRAEFVVKDMDDEPETLEDLEGPDEPAPDGDAEPLPGPPDEE
jgi:uncharacterized hydrophobic protein (TIGR00271 family)